MLKPTPTKVCRDFSVASKARGTLLSDGKWAQIGNGIAGIDILMASKTASELEASVDSVCLSYCPLNSSVSTSFFLSFASQQWTFRKLTWFLDKPHELDGSGIPGLSGF